ncbi:MgtC/SapB family protein [Paludibacterium yongneupense]|uniref:MgtC/SapB family protein n=1 Tax=Paludibacterium yongneupense TaxID=400061 RepID=UPI0003FFBE91|nr:MgtC/SapB family protein [Paludibacterium yongneupense]
MPVTLSELFSQYWGAPKLFINLMIFLHLLGSLALGMMVGYERSYNGRAAGMRTYGLVCMASTAAVVIVGYSQSWYGGGLGNMLHGDMTRVAQGILSGIGFLGAGLIMKEGFSISGLTSAASIWASAVIGILVGVGFYAAAIMLAVLAVLCLVVVSRIERMLPGRASLYITMRFSRDHPWTMERLRGDLDSFGFILHEDSLSVRVSEASSEWSYMVSAKDKKNTRTVTHLTMDILRVEHIEEFSVQPARN